MSRSRAAALVGALALLAGCAVAPAPMTQPQIASVGTADGLTWGPCTDRRVTFDCATLRVPLDYEHPEAGTIDLALKRYTKSGAQPGRTILVNPGGPGVSGIDMVSDIRYYVPPELLDTYAVVGFDPRGVGASEGVRCLTDAEQDAADAAQESEDLETDAGWAQAIEEATAYGQACRDKTGDRLGFLDTRSAARDMDQMRAALNLETLDYLGFSYGTSLGATYAELFPDRVGRFVLDGAVDPTLTFEQLAAGQVVGFERAYRAFLRDCVAHGCALGDTEDAGYQATLDLLTRLEADPAPTGDPKRPASDDDLVSAIATALYSDTSWETLRDALDALVTDDDGAQVKYLSDYAAQRDEDGHYPPDEGAFHVIDCLDQRVTTDRAEITAAAQALPAGSALFGPYFGYGEIACTNLPSTGREPVPIHAAGAAPILVVGTTRDPATPYEWAQAMAEQLDSGVFLGRDGDGHTAYGTGSCLDETITEFLVRGTVPASTTC